MFKFEKYIPSQSLKDYINYYWSLDITGDDIDPDYEERVIPLGFAEIIIHYGDPFLMKVEKNVCPFFEVY